MPLPVAPMKTTRQSCCWSKVVPQQGDVLFPSNQCERCGSEHLNLTPAGMMERMKPTSILKNYFWNS